MGRRDCWFGFCLAVSLVAWGCGKEKGPTVDPQPFKTAIAAYLERNNMAMAVKEIKEGPVVQGNTATLTASLTHAQIPGPAVLWKFTFEKAPDGKWQVLRHEPR